METSKRSASSETFETKSYGMNFSQQRPGLSLPLYDIDGAQFVVEVLEASVYFGVGPALNRVSLVDLFVAQNMF